MPTCIRAALAVALAAPSWCAPVFAYEVTVVNDSEHAVGAPVQVRLADLPANLRVPAIAVRHRDGGPCAAQTEDTDGDGAPDTLVFRIEVPGQSGRAVVLAPAPALDSVAVERRKGVAWAQYMWTDFRMENRYLRCHLPTCWHETDKRPLRIPPDVPFPGERRGRFEVRDRRDDRLLLDFTLQPDRARYVVEDLRQQLTTGPVRDLVSRVRMLRDAENADARFRVEQRLFLNKHDRRIDLELAIANSGEGTHNVSGLRVLEGKMGNDLQDLAGKLRNLTTASERRARLWHNAATGFGLAYIPHQPDQGWQEEVVGTGYFRFAGGPGPKIRLSGLRGDTTLAPGEETRFRFSFVFYDAKDFRAVHERFLRDVHQVPGPLSASGEDGTVLCIANGPLYVADGLRNPSRWVCEPGARLERTDPGLEVSAVKAGKGVFTAFARDFSEPTELRGEAVPTTENTALRVSIKEARTGEVHDVATVDGAFRIDLGKELPFKGLTTGTLHLRPVVTGKAAEKARGLAVRLNALTMSWPQPEPPRLLWPREGQPLTNVAVVFDMRSAGGWERGYEIQVARDRGFEQVVIAGRQKRTKGLKRERFQTKYLPDRLLDQGTYFWRVRPLDWSGQPGDWTEVRSFVVDDAKPGKREPVRPIGPSRPAFFVSGMGKAKGKGDSRANLLDALGARYGKPMCDLFLEQRVYEPGGHYPIPIFAVTSSQPTLPLIEHAFRNEPRVVGIVFAEYGFEPGYLRRVLMLAAKYGRYVSTLNMGLDIMQQTVLSEEFFPLVEEYGRYLLPQQKQNNRRDQLARIATELGAYLTGRAGAWGTETEYGFAWKPMAWSRWERSHHIDYPLNWMRTYVFGLSVGASLYRTEGFENNKFSPYWRGDTFGPLWERGMGPFFEDVLKYDMVPTREEILRKARVGIAGKPQYGLTRPSSPLTRWPNRVFGALHGLPIRGVPVQHIVENTWTPDWPRCYVVPVLPAFLRPEDRALFADVIDADSFDYPESALAHVRQFYPPTEGDAYSVLVGDTGVVLHSIDDRRDPRAKVQSFRLALTKGPVASVEGTLSYQAYLLMKQMDDALFVHANNFEMHYTHLRFRSRDGRRLAIEDPLPSDNAITSRKWDAASGTFALVLNFHGGVPRFRVKAVGQRGPGPAKTTRGKDKEDVAPPGAPEVAADSELRPPRDELVFTTYPDPTERLLVDILRRVGRAYERAVPEAPRVRVEAGLTYRAARELVTCGQACGMLISEEINLMRAAIIGQRGQDKRGRGFGKVELNVFVPIAKRIIRSEQEVLSEVRLGFATRDLTPELERFLGFLSSEHGQAAVREVPFVVPVVRREQPEPVGTAPYKPYKSGHTVQLEDPVQTY